MNNPGVFILMCALAISVCLVGCAGAPLPTPSPLPAPSFTPTAAPTNTAAPVPSPTVTATVAPTPTSVPSPTRTFTPVPVPLTGWMGKLGGPDSARANLTAKLALPLKLAWEWKDGNNKPVGIAVARGQVFLLTSSGQLCILDAKTGVRASCRVIWPEVKGSTQGQIALSGDTVVVSALETYIKPGDKYGSGRTMLAAFSFDGAPRWSQPPLENQLSEAIVLANNLIVSVSRISIEKYWITARDMASGAQRWQIQGAFEHGATDRTNLYTDSDNVSALRLGDGERVWNVSANALHVIYADKRIFGLGNNSITALDAATGNVLWKTAFGVFPLDYNGVGVAAAHNHVYLIPSPGQTHQGYRVGVMALDAATGKEIWSFVGEDKLATEIAATADAVVVTGEEWNGSVFAKKLWVLNPANGAELNSLVMSTDSMEEHGELAVADNQVYVLGRTLRVYGK